MSGMVSHMLIKPVNLDSTGNVTISTGRGVSYDLTPPLILTQAHEYWHEKNSSRVEDNKNMAKLKEKATNSRDKSGAIIKDVV
jgi:hypothetical protein